MIIDAFRHSVELLSMKSGALRRLLRRTHNKESAFVMMILGAFLVALGRYVFPVEITETLVYRLDFGAALWLFIKWVFFNGLMIAVVAMVADQWMESKLKGQDLAILMGHLLLVQGLMIYPPLWFVSAVWFVYVLMDLLRKEAELDWPSVALLLALPVFGFLLLVFLGIL